MNTRILTHEDLSNNPDLVDFGLDVGNIVVFGKSGLPVMIDGIRYYIPSLYEQMDS